MLKIGDIVKIREDLSYDMEKVGLSISIAMLAYIGKTGTVVDIDDDKTVKLDIDNKDWWWHEDWLEKLNKFSVGDKVVVCYEEPEGLDETLPYKLLELLADMANLSKPAEYNGKIGKIVSFKGNGANIEFEGEEKPIWMPYGWLKEYVHKFKKGDKVRIARSGEELTNCAGGWYSYMKEYVGDVVTIGERSYDYDNGIVGYFVKKNKCIWDERLLEPIIEEEKTVCFTGKVACIIEPIIKEEKAEPEYFTGKVVCINDNYRCDITKGRIYDFKNGEALDDAGKRFPCNNHLVHNVDELNDYYKDCGDEDAPQFIEIVE